MSTALWLFLNDFNSAPCLCVSMCSSSILWYRSLRPVVIGPVNFTVRLFPPGNEYFAEEKKFALRVPLSNARLQPWKIAEMGIRLRDRHSLVPRMSHCHRFYHVPYSHGTISCLSAGDWRIKMFRKLRQKSESFFHDWDLCTFCILRRCILAVFHDIVLISAYYR